MSADILKVKTYDGRIVQKRPAYAVCSGALSATAQPTQSIAATASQMSFNIISPSENVFLDRALEWSATGFLQFVVATVVPPAVGESIVVPGRDFSLAQYPLNTLCSTVSMTVNDCTTTITTSDVLPYIMRLADQKMNRQFRKSPYMLDKYRTYNDSFGTINNTIGAYDTATDYDNVGNGAYPFLEFTDPLGNALGTAAPAFAGANYDCLNGVPIGNGAAGPFTIYVKFRSTENIVVPGACFADTHEQDTGFFGITSIQLLMNFQAAGDNGVGRVIRSCVRAGRTIQANSVAFNNTVPAGVWQNAVVNTVILTPALSLPLPNKNSVPYVEYPRYLGNVTTLPANSTVQLNSPTITLPSVPDLLLVFARPVGLSTQEADFVFPIASSPQNTVRPLQVTFDNYSNLLSSFSTEELYYISLKNGLNVDYATFVGRARSSAGSYPSADYPGGFQQGGVVNLAGAPLVLKMSEDISTATGTAPGCVGNYSLQINLSVTNFLPVSRQAQLVIITINTGFLETIRGSTRIAKAILSEQDVISAEPLSERPSLQRMVGGFSFSSLANAITKAKDIYEKTKPIASAIASALPEEGRLGVVKKGMKAVGYGQMGHSGGMGMTGGRKYGRSLAERLM